MSEVLEKSVTLRSVAVCVALAIAAVLPYMDAGSFEFVSFDDPGYVYDNPLVNEGLRWEAVGEAFAKTRMANWHPLTWVSHMLDCTLFGLEPGGHHLMNVGLHALNAVLLLLALRALTGSFWRSALVAALFAVHPLRAESVAWISERKDVLSGTFWMLSLWVYARHARRPTEKSFSLLMLVFGLGLLAKPMLVTLPCVLLLLDFWPLRGLRPVRTLIREKAWMLLLAASVAMATLFAQEAGHAIKSTDLTSLGDRVLNAFNAYTGYVLDSVWPTGLAFFYPHPAQVGRPFVGQALVSAAVLALMTFGVFRQRVRRPWLLLGWLWYVGTLVPVIGILQVGAQAMADRYTYLTTIGLGIMLAWQLGDFVARAETPAAKLALTRALSALCLVAIVALGVTAHAQAGTWKNSRSLYEHALQVTQDNAPAHLHLGVVHLDRGDLDTAEEHFLASLAIEQDEPMAYVNLGNVHMKRGENELAKESFREALRLNPGTSEPHNNLGILFANEGRFDEALKHLRMAVQNDPENTAAVSNLKAVRVMKLQAQRDDEGR